MTHLSPAKTRAGRTAKGRAEGNSYGKDGGKGNLPSPDLTKAKASRENGKQWCSQVSTNGKAKIFSERASRQVYLLILKPDSQVMHQTYKYNIFKCEPQGVQRSDWGGLGP